MTDKTKLQDHIFNGIKRTIPVIVLYSILLALSDLLPFLEVVHPIVYYAIVPVLSFNILYSMYKGLYIFPAVFVGIFASIEGLGILGGILVGVLMGLSINLIYKYLFKDKDSNTYMIVGLNILLTGLFYLLTVYVISPPVGFVLTSIFDYLGAIDGNNVLLLVSILSLLTTVDLGGPFNKISFAFIIEMLLQESYNIVGPVLISVTVPTLGIYLAMLLYKDRFSESDLSQKRFAMFASIVGMTEGALAVSFRRIKILPVVMIGSLLGTLFAAINGLENRLLMASIPGFFGTSNIMIYVLSHIIGVVFILIVLPLILKREETSFVIEESNGIIE